MVISVTQLNNYIKATFETDEILQNLTVKGELTNVKSSHGNTFFTLKDENSHVDCFCYLADNGQFQQGAEVEAVGSIRYLEKTGKISFFVKKLTLCGKNGLQHLKFLQLREKLKKEGIFDQNRKKSLPKICKTIGVVTSKEGAVIKDIQDVVLRRQCFSDIFLYPVRVQGENAENEIVTAIDYFSKSAVDVVIVARGGGSNEDLSVFNSENVVRAIANCKKPTVSAVGHGVDFTLSDFAADLRAVTPSEAAELVTIDAPKYCQQILSTLLLCKRTIVAKFRLQKSQVTYKIKHLASIVQNQLSSKQKFALKACNSAANAVSYKHFKLQREIEALLEIISFNNPTNVLKRGFAAVFSDGQRIQHINQLSVGQKINLTLHDGKASANILSIEKGKQNDFGKKS